MMIPSAQVNRGGAGLQASPAVPASTIALLNPFSFACIVTIRGTVSAVTINGQALALLGSTYLVGAGQSIAMTYITPPAWDWFGIG